MLKHLCNWKVQLAIIIALAGLGMFAKLDQTELQPLGSAAHASIAREILRTNDWLTLHWPHCEEFSDFYQHPPLFFWLQALTFKIFGVNDLTAKLTSSFFGFLIIVLTFFIGSFLSNSYMGFLSSATLILTPYFFRHSRKCEVETILVFFMALAFFFFIVAEKKNNSKYLLFTGISTGLAFLSKGPPALAIFPSIFLYYLLTKSYKKINFYFFSGVFLSVFIPLIWIIPQIIYKGSSFYQKYIVNQILWKIAGGDRPQLNFQQKLLGYFFFFGAFYTYYLPWSITGIFGITKIIKEKLKEYYIFIIWAVVVWTGFSLAGYKDDYYLLAFLPGWAIINGLILQSWAKRFEPKVIFSFMVILVVFALLLVFTPFKLGKVRNPEFLHMKHKIKNIVPENEKIIIYNLFYWDMIALFPWYTDRGTTHEIKTLDELKTILKNSSRKYVFMKKTDFDNIYTQDKELLTSILSYGKYVLATNTK